MKTQSKAYKQSNEDLQKSNASLRTKLEAVLKEKATMSAAIVAKDKELENYREDDEFSDSTHHTRQNRYKKENDSLCSDIEALRKSLLKSQEDLDMTTRNRNELEYEIQALRTTIRKNSAIMETQRVDLGTYKSANSRLESK